VGGSFASVNGITTPRSPADHLGAVEVLGTAGRRRRCELATASDKRPSRRMRRFGEIGL